MDLELGGGLIPRRGYTNLDPVHGVGEWRRRVQDVPWPAGDETVTRLRASHLLEHIPKADHITVMNEAWRVLQSGGEFEIWMPLAFVDDQLNSSYGPWADPTHVSFWHFPGSFLYFTGEYRANADYGISYWEPLDRRFCDLSDWNNCKIVLRKP